jgi:hypothetical protein
MNIIDLHFVPYVKIQFYDRTLKLTHEIQPNECDFILFRGDQLHSVKNISGFGIRLLLIFYFSVYELIDLL